MTKLDESDKHQENVAKIIVEFKKKDELLKKFSKKFSEVTSKISDLESELIVWEKEKENLQKNPANKKEVETWQKQINTITKNINNKEADLKSLQKKVDDLNIKNQHLKDQIQVIETQHIEYVSYQIREFQQVSGNVQHHDKCNEKLVSNLELLKYLWKIQGKDHDLAKFVKFFNSKNLEVNLEVLNDLFKETKGYFIPPIIPELIDTYLKDYDIKNIVEPGCKIGSCMFQLKSHDKSKLTAFLEDPNDKKVINLIYPNKTINFKFDVEELQEFSDNYFDVVVGFCENNKKKQIDFNAIYDTGDTINFFQTLLKLKDEGFGFCILNPELKLNWEDNSVFTNLEKYGLYIDSIISLASEIFPERNSDKTLIIIKKIKPEKIFIGELNTTSKDILIENLKKRRAGKIPQHGLLIDLESFYSFHNILAKKESEYLALSTELEPLKFNEIVKEIFNHNNFSENDEDFNYLFLPFDHNANVVLSSQNFEYEPKMYLQIFFEPEIALADYVARFYNTQLGKKIRESFAIGNVILEVSKKLLFDSYLYLPDLDKQIDLVRVDSLITELTTRAESYKLKLWNSPLKVSDIQKEIEYMDDGKSEKKFEQWIESLPYPIASILWCSITNPSYERKVKYLLHFFEAFSEFNMALLLSGLSSDEKFFQIEVKRCFRDDSRFRNWYFKPTFGNWYKFGSCLSRTIRRLLEENETKCLEVFGNPDPEFLLSIANKDLITISEGVANYRNQWEGHGPVVSEKEYQNRYKILRSVLSRVYQILSDSYENTFLILPLQSSFHDGVHNYGIRRYMGTRAPFKPGNIETLKPLDKSKIYLAYKNQRKPVELLPFLINIDNVCYFYNGQDYDTGKARYVSYHYHEKPEILLPMDKFNQVISLLKP